MPSITLTMPRQVRRDHPYSRPVRPRRENLQKLSGVDLKETNKRILSLIQAANDGRKRATALPPLPMEREQTFHRQPRTMQSLQGPAEEAAESHWQRKFVRVSMDVDKRIISHLKKQMNRRLQQRIDDISLDDESSTYTPGRDGLEADKDKQARITKVSDNGLFYKYTDYGEKLDGKQPPETNGRRGSMPQKKSKESKSVHINMNGHAKKDNAHRKNSKTNVHVTSETKIVTNGEAGHHTKDNEPLVNGVNGTSADSQGEHNENQTNGDTGEPTEEDDHILDNNDQEVYDFNINTHGLANSQEIESFRKLDVSPIQTPCVLRPLTREKSRYSINDRISAVLHGHVHRNCLPENKVLQIYICSGFYDTLPERTGIMEKVLPQLREISMAHDYELEIQDLHWGLADVMSDDHSIPDTCITSLNKCLESTHGFNMLVVMGDKYGPYLLPSKIPVDEFNELYDHVEDTVKRELEIIQDQFKEIEVNRALRDQQRVEFEAMRDDPEKKANADDDISTETALKNMRRNTEATKQEAQLIKNLQEQEKDMVNPEVLKEWYQMDENCVPPVYKLQNVSSQFKDFTATDYKKRQVAKESFIDIAKKLRRIFDEFTDFVVKDAFARKKYFTTLLGSELEHGVLETDAADNHCVVVHRSIKGVHSHVNDPDAANFIDLSARGEHRVDTTQKTIISELKNEILPSKVGVPNILAFDVDWAPGGVIIGGHRLHINYIERMCKQLLDMMKRHLQKNFEEDHNKTPSMQLYGELSQHVAFCHEKTSHFQGRKDLLQLVKSYVRSQYPTPLVLHGVAGCGKTAILCKAAKEMHKWFKGQNISVLLRIVGKTTDTTNARALLRGLCLQMCEICGSSYDDVPTDYKGLMNDFNQRIVQTAASSPLVIILDSLDRLSDDYDGRKLGWLPKDLPKNVRVIVSTNPGEKYECLPALKKSFPENADVFLEIPELPEQDAIMILEHWLHKQDRTLTGEQFDFLLDSFKKCPYPLYLRIAFHESLSWTSYTPMGKIKLADNVKQFALLKFGRLETKHGDALTRRALGYITASRNGVTNNEMVDLLSLDEAVMDEVMSIHRPPRRRLPMVLWARLRDDLSEYITEIKSYQRKTWKWSHSQFKEAAEERYMLNRDKAPSYHKAMAEYFLGLWADSPKPHNGNEKGMLRFVSGQHMFYELENAPKDGSERVYNLRKINELPHHLLNSQQMEKYKSQALCNFEWVLAKLCGTSLRELLEEYQIGLQVEPGDTDLKTLSDTIQLSAKALIKDPRQLATQMIGRLHGMLARDIPATAGDPPKYPFLHAFYDQAKTPSLLSLLPSISCLSEPGGILFDLLSGHCDPITAITLTSDGTKAITASSDNTMKLWNIKTGRVMKTIEGTGTQVKSIIPGNGNNYAITVEGSIIRVWNLRYSECVLSIDHYLDPPKIGTAAEGKYLVAVFDGINIIRTWNLGKQIMPMVCESKIEDHSVYTDNSLLIAPTSFDEKVLHAFRGANLGTVQNARNGKVSHTLKCNEKSSSIVALGVTRDYYVMACRQQYMTLHEIHQLELFDLKKGKYLRSVRGCTHDYITEMHINFMGSHAICVCASEKTSTTSVAIWNIETQDHKHLVKHAGVSSMSACVDFRYCITAAKGDKTMRIWNLSGRINQSQPKYKKSLGVTQIVPMIDNPRYVVARQMNHGAISVWNVAKAKCLQSAVRIERGLSESADVVIIRNARVVILSDRGFSSAAESSRPVFQTVLIYDLQLKKYVKKLTGCYITPCPVDEYVLLDDDHLLGLSDNRSHFVIWNLVTGHADRRIKPNREVFPTQIPHKFEEPTSVRSSTATMTPWERRAESESAKQHRHEQEMAQERKHQEDLRKEKENGIEQYLLSGDQSIAVVSYFAHHLCVFDIKNEKHLHTLESPNSMLHLHVSALTFDGSHLVLPNYDEETKTSYVTLWDCLQGSVKKRLKNESNVMAIGILDDASRVIIGKAKNELHIWDPMARDGLRKIKGYQGLEFNFESKIYVTDNGKRAVVHAGDVSVWDIERASVLAIFTPDMRINCCNVAMNGQLITFGLHDIQDLVVLKLGSKDVPPITDLGEDIFGEVAEESSDEEDEDDY